MAKITELSSQAAKNWHGRRVAGPLPRDTQTAKLVVGLPAGAVGKLSKKKAESKESEPGTSLEAQREEAACRGDKVLKELTETQRDKPATGQSDDGTGAERRPEGHQAKPGFVIGLGPG